MSITQLIEEIKSRLDIAEIVGEDVPLHQRGREWVGHDTRHDSVSGTSLAVNPESQLWFCFNCREGGDVLTWLMNFRGMSFGEALAYAAERAGIPLPHLDPAERARLEFLRADREDLTRLFMAAADYFYSQLKEQHYQELLIRWGIREETVRRLKIGYAPVDGQGLLGHLINFDRELIKKSGLFWVNGDRLSPIFRGRIMFPYQQNHQPVYFIGRWYPGCPDDEKIKYKKQLVYGPEKEFVSPAVRNDYFYGEDTIRGAKVILITEGVADCIAANQAGLACISPVTVTFREKDFPRMSRLVKKAEKIYICNDNEESEAGIRGALKTAEYLESQDISVGIIQLPESEDLKKIDLADFLRERGDAGLSDLKELMAKSKSHWEIKAENLEISENPVAAMQTVWDFCAEELAGCSPLVKKTIIRSVFKEKLGLDTDDIKSLTAATQEKRLKAAPLISCIGDVEPEEVGFLWNPYIPIGKLTILDGDPGIGKTWTALKIAATVSKGDPFPDPRDGISGERGEPAKVIYLTAEDGLADTLRPRLDAMGADVKNIYAITGQSYIDKKTGEEKQTGVTLQDIYILRQAMQQLKPRLVVVDPLQAYLGAGIDLYRANEVRPILSNLAKMAEEYKCAVLLIRHLGKGSKDRAIYRGLGSVDFAAAARSILLAGQDPRNPQDKALIQIKSSLAEMGPSIGYELRDAKFHWTGISHLTAENVLAPTPREDEIGTLDEAENFLRAALSEGPVEAKEIQKQRKAAGISERTLNRAKKTLNVKSLRIGNVWYWASPEVPLSVMEDFLM
jgi:DNA primase catalytic core